VAANPSAPVELDERDEPALAAAELAPLVAAHNEHARKLETLESRASVEIRSRDAEGEHFDQCEGDIFLAPGGKGALRLTKLGSNLAWIGSDGTRGWMFRLDAEPTQATVYANARSGALGDSDPIRNQGGFRLLTPDGLRSLAALAPIPADAALERVRSTEPAPASSTLRDRFAIAWTVPGGARLAMQFGADGKPSRIVARDESGREILRAALSDFVRAQAENLAIGAWPELPRKIEITTPDGATSVRIYLGEPSAMARRMKPRFFELEALIAQLRPDTVEYLETPVEVPARPGATEERGDAGAERP
jgi:hypothetical protein